MKVKYTPGPWHFGRASREIWGNGKTIAKIAPGMLTGFHAPTIDEQDANACVISKAPRLIECLQNLIGNSPIHDSTPGWREVPAVYADEAITLLAEIEHGLA